MGYPIEQGSTSDKDSLLFMMIDETDHITGLTGLTPTVSIRKPGGSGAAPSGAITEVDPGDHPGLYKVAANSTDNNTLGPLAFHASATGADPVDDIFFVVEGNPTVVDKEGFILDADYDHLRLTSDTPAGLVVPNP